MSQKVYDNKNRWRSKVVAFRVSPEEWDELEDKIKLCGYGTKQDYILDCLYNSEIKAMGNPMMLTQFRKDFRRMREELELLPKSKYRYIILSGLFSFADKP